MRVFRVPSAETRSISANTSILLLLLSLDENAELRSDCTGTRIPKTAMTSAQNANIEFSVRIKCSERTENLADSAGAKSDRRQMGVCSLIELTKTNECLASRILASLAK